jgi:hypothetical protein
MIKIILTAIIITASIFGIHSPATFGTIGTIGQLEQWKLSGTTLIPRNNTWTVGNASTTYYGDGSNLSGIVSGQWTATSTYIYANNSTSTVVTDSGYLGIGTASPSSSLTIKAKSGQTDDLIDIQDSSGSTLTNIDKDGYFYSQGIGFGTGVPDHTGGNYIIGAVNVPAPAGFKFTNSNTVSPARAQFVFGSSLIHNHYAILGFNNYHGSGIWQYQRSFFLGFDTGGTIVGTGKNYPFMFAVGGTEVGRFTPSTYRLGINTTAPSAQLEVRTKSATTPVIIARGYSSQTADLQQWQNSSGNVLVSIASGGALKLPITTITASATLDASNYTVLVDGSSASITVSLPQASTVTGRIYVVKCIDDTNAVVVDPYSTETIDGSTTLSFTKWDSIMIQSDGSNWLIL